MSFLTVLLIHLGFLWGPRILALCVAEENVEYFFFLRMSWITFMAVLILGVGQEGIDLVADWGQCVLDLADEERRLAEHAAQGMESELRIPSALLMHGLMHISGRGLLSSCGTFLEFLIVMRHSCQPSTHCSEVGVTLQIRK